MDFGPTGEVGGVTAATQVSFALRWYLAVQLFGLAALPLALRLFRHLPGRGYAFARPLGLLIGGWLFWLLMTFGWLPNTAGAVLAALALLVAGGSALWLYSSSGNPAAGSESAETLSWQHVLAIELLLALTFAAWCLVRAYMPRIETAGGEKWMEIAFLNAVLRAPRFPPHDPWLSGFAISYYYFGYVMIGMVIRLTAVPSTVGFNLGIATLFALTCTGAYGLVYVLLARAGERKAAWRGLLGPLLVAVTGNLEGLLEVFHARGLFPASFWRWLDIRSINVPPPPFAEGSWVPTRFIWWWQASRVLHDYAPWHTPAHPAEWEVIDEFPAFSFLLGDMHPHLLALPFVLMALALALALLFRRSETSSGFTFRVSRFAFHVNIPLSPWEFLTYALCLGGLGFLNTWDFPIYLFVVVAACALASCRRNPQRAARLSPAVCRSLFLFAFLLAVCGFTLYLPFWLGFRSQAAGIAPNLFNGTRLPQFLVMFGPLLFPVAVLAAAEARKRRVKGWEVVGWTVGVLAGLLAFLLLAGLISSNGRQYLAAWRSGGAIPGLEHMPDAPRLIVERLQERVLAPWTPLMLASLLTTALLVLFGFRVSDFEVPGSENLEPETPRRETLKPETAYALLLVVTGALLTLAVEFVYLRDLFGTRMNTVFKFYFQAWALWGIAGAYGLARLLDRASLGRASLGRASLGRASVPARRDDGGGWAAMPALVLALLLVGAGLLYPVLAIPTRAREYGGPPTLDGAEHLRWSQAADFAAINWLNGNVVGTPVILEAPGDQYRSWVYEGRVSAFTGLPTLLGWGHHEHQ
ncbi:MAG TPA: hypothetical protein ENI39_06850, partial [Anaerolineae bacterium]|nr:hypothetical protein [Anaerolineae bacterium]